MFARLRILQSLRTTARRPLYRAPPRFYASTFRDQQQQQEQSSSSSNNWDSAAAPEPRDFQSFLAQVRNDPELRKRRQEWGTGWRVIRLFVKRYIGQFLLLLCRMLWIAVLWLLEKVRILMAVGVMLWI